MVPDSAIELTGFSVHRSDRTKELTGKSRGGGVCFYINNSWCDERNIHSIKFFCSPDLEFHTLLCRPFWLTREFTAIIITAVYIPPQANTDQALRELYRNISEQETANPDAAFIIMGDFNKANFRTIAPKYFQHFQLTEVSPLSLSVADVTRSFKQVNIRKAMGPDGIPGRVLKACAFELAGVFTDILNPSLSLSVVPSCFKKSTIVPIPKKNKIKCLNDWRPAALTPIFSKYFEKLVREHICSVLPASLDPLQFAYRSNRSTDDAIAFTLLSPTWKIRTPM